ncbi:hypothetical protein SDC9_188219 [bioreactor metagenome]|uniref:Uncharacterized protein n=1 Tax=bioreactor metagenome TaxID=1076179 RepID=A0A645HNQ6_9ZZZZ
MPPRANTLQHGHSGIQVRNETVAMLNRFYCVCVERIRMPNGSKYAALFEFIAKRQRTGQFRGGRHTYNISACVQKGLHMCSVRQAKVFRVLRARLCGGKIRPFQMHPQQIWPVRPLSLHSFIASEHSKQLFV